MTTVAPHPLQWPAGRHRRTAAMRKAGRFSTRDYRGDRNYKTTADITVAQALSRLQAELDRIGARYPVVSSNLETRLDGLPRSGAREPVDPGVAVYFQLDGKPICMPCDTYLLVSHNIAAIAAHIEATRAIERHGVATVAEMFSGFVALPPTHRHWRDAMNLRGTVTREQVERTFRDLAKRAHPDAGGSHEAMADLTRARDEALKEIR